MRSPQEVQDELFREEMKTHNGNLSRVARALGLPYAEVIRKAQTRPAHLMAPTLGPEPQDIREVAKPGFEQFAIAIKRVGCGWPDKYEAVLQEARRLFDLGTHEMFQSNTHGWVVQYLIPRNRPVAPRRFFLDCSL